jgi:hypothetical protein
MAVETFQPLSRADGYRRRPLDEHGKLRFLTAKFLATVAGDANSLMIIGKLPPGAVRVLPGLSRYWTSAFGAARVMVIGHPLYAKKEDGNVVGDGNEAADDDAFAAGLDVSAAGNNVVWSNTIAWFDVYSRAGVEVQAKVTGGTIPLNATAAFLLAYIYE